MGGGQVISVSDPEAVKAKLQAIVDAFEHLPALDALPHRRGPRAQHSAFVADYDRDSWLRFKEAMELVLKLRVNTRAIVEGAQDVVDQMVKQDEELQAELQRVNAQLGGGS